MELKEQETPTPVTPTTLDTVEANTESRRQLASVQKILTLDPIEGADKIEVATVLGWHVVVQKGLHKVGDLVIYVEVDSVLPDKPEFEWMRPYSFRVKTIKLRKQISQGIILPIRDLPQVTKDVEGTQVIVDPDNPKLSCAFIHEGLDVTEYLHITKYVRPESNHGPSNLRKGRPDNWPRWIPKTDELRVQGIYKYVESHLGKEFFWTEKLDGQSMTCYYKDKEFGVCSRNFDLEPGEACPFWKTARDAKVEEKLKKAFETEGVQYAVQGERIGPGIQKNKLALNEVEYRIFNVYDIDKQQYLGYNDFKDFCTQYGFKSVPMGLEPFKLEHTCDQIVAMSVKKSALNKDIWAEGIVLRTVEEGVDPKLGRISFKAINPEFLLKYGE